VGISRTGDRLVVRLLASSGLTLRRLVIPIITSLSGAGSLPRLWSL
jgi:urease accessory protein